jgi:hypothetical protein
VTSLCEATRIPVFRYGSDDRRMDASPPRFDQAKYPVGIPGGEAQAYQSVSVTDISSPRTGAGRSSSEEADRRLSDFCLDLLQTTFGADSATNPS